MQGPLRFHNFLEPKVGRRAESRGKTGSSCIDWFARSLGWSPAGRLLQGLLTSPVSELVGVFAYVDLRCNSKYTLRILLREPRNYLATQDLDKKAPSALASTKPLAILSGPPSLFITGEKGGKQNHFVDSNSSFKNRREDAENHNAARICWLA